MIDFADALAQLWAEPDAIHAASRMECTPDDEKRSRVTFLFLTAPDLGDGQVPVLRVQYHSDGSTVIVPGKANVRPPVRLDGAAMAQAALREIKITANVDATLRPTDRFGRKYVYDSSSTLYYSLPPGPNGERGGGSSIIHTKGHCTLIGRAF